MQLRGVRMTSFALTLALSTALACAAFGAVAGSAMAGGFPSRDTYSVNISPSSVQKDSSTTFDVAMANTSTLGRTIGAAAITPPLGFRVTGASLPTGAKGHVYVWFNVVLLDHLSVPPGSTLHVAVTATAPSRCNTRFTRWFTVATGGLFRELMFPDSSSSLTTNVTCDVATRVDFANQPAHALVGSTITNSPYNTSGNAVTVDLVDAGGNTVNTTGTPVTIALASNPGNATLTGTLTQNTVNGVATFNDLKLDKPDNGYTLTATSSGVTSATSNSFDENDQAKACTAGTDCTDTITSGSGSLGVDIPSPGSNSTLTLSTDVGTPMDGTGANPNDTGCARYTPPLGSADWYEFVEQPAATTDRQIYDAKTITWTVNNAENGDNNFEVCFGAPYDFQTGFDDAGAPILAPQNPLPDGTIGFVGLLDTCSDLGDAQSSNPCVSNQVGVGDTGIQVTVAIPANEQGDPWVGR